MVVSLLNPKVLVLGGDIALTSEHFLMKVREVIYSRTPAAGDPQPRGGPPGGRPGRDGGRRRDGDRAGLRDDRRRRAGRRLRGDWRSRRGWREVDHVGEAYVGLNRRARLFPPTSACWGAAAADVMRAQTAAVTLILYAAASGRPSRTRSSRRTSSRRPPTHVRPWCSSSRPLEQLLAPCRGSLAQPRRLLGERASTRCCARPAAVALSGSSSSV